MPRSGMAASGEIAGQTPSFEAALDPVDTHSVRLDEGDRFRWE